MQYAYTVCQCSKPVKHAKKKYKKQCLGPVFFKQPNSNPYYFLYSYILCDQPPSEGRLINPLRDGCNTCLLCCLVLCNSSQSRFN